MTSLPVKNIGAVMNEASSGAAMATQSANSMSFESVWNNRTERISSSEPVTEGARLVQKENDMVRNSLKSKDSYKSVVSKEEAVQESNPDELKNMTPEEWDRVMEVLGAAAVEMVQQLADAFGITVEEVQNLMNELGMEPLDVLQQETLGQLILATGGETDTTSLLTNEELYQKYQALMGQLNGLLENVGEAVQLDVEQPDIQQLVQIAADNTRNNTPFIEVTVDEEMKRPEETETVLPDDSTYDMAIEHTGSRVENTDGTEQADNQMQNQNGNQSLEQGKEAGNPRSGVAEGRGTGEPLVLQNLRAESFEPQLQQLTQTTSAWDADTLDIMKQIMDYMKIQVKPDMSDLEMQLHPENLGTLQVHVASKGGAVTAQFVTQNETVKAALEGQMIQLKESFAEQGVKVDAIEVTVQTHQFEQNLEQGRGRQQNEPERRTRTRRIQLDETFTMEDFNAMDGEEQLAAEMMEANGNTVDYTA